MIDTAINADTINNEFNDGITKLNRFLNGFIKKQAMNNTNTVMTMAPLHLSNGLQTVYNVQI